MGSLHYEICVTPERVNEQIRFALLGILKSLGKIYILTLLSSKSSSSLKPEEREWNTNIHVNNLYLYTNINIVSICIYCIYIQYSVIFSCTSPLIFLTYSISFYIYSISSVSQDYLDVDPFSVSFVRYFCDNHCCIFLLMFGIVQILM